MCRETGGNSKNIFKAYKSAGKLRGNSTNDFLIPTKVQGNSGETQKINF